MHCLPVKFIAVFRRMLPARRETAVITLPEVEPMIDVSVKMFRPVEPGTGADEYAIIEPFRPVVPVGAQL